MPDVIGVDEGTAEGMLRNVGLVQITPVDDFTDAHDPGTVVASDPLAHQFVMKSGTIIITVARDTARARARGAQLRRGHRGRLEYSGYQVVVQRTSSRTVPAGSVISVSPGVGSSGKRGDTATLKVSTGAPLATVPNVIKHDADDACDELEGLGFVVNEVPVTITSGSSGKVVTQDPASGQLAEGATVTIGVGVRAR